MDFFRLALLAAIILVASAKEDNIKNRGKRQQIAFYPRRGARPPPYAVQMEPIVQYSQRDPLYNPLIDAKSDSADEYIESPAPYYHHSNAEPEPIIEIIIKESNESLPTPPPQTPPPQPKPTKEPIQVFYVKYEKKKGYGGDGKSKVVYDAPIPALTPVEEHEVIRDPAPTPYAEELAQSATPPPPEPSTTLRAIIRPESETYHSGSSGIRVTFGTDQVPPNNHNKRSDLESQSRQVSTSQPHLINNQQGPPTQRQQHITPYHPFQQQQQQGPPRVVSPAFPQQRIVNSYPPQQQFFGQNIPAQQQLPPNHPQHQYQGGPVKNGQRPPPPQRLPITVQGLPELQQRLPFSNFPSPHRVNINHPQQPGFPPTLSVSHQNVLVQNPPQVGPINNFKVDQQRLQQQQQQQQQHHFSSFKQQELEKQKYYEQRRQQELIKQREQHRFAEQRLQEQQQQRLQEQQQQRRPQEHDYRLKYPQQDAPSGPPAQQQHQQQQQQQQQQRPQGEILKSVSKLEQHYAIRENPLHPGPFPPNPSHHQASLVQHPPSVTPQPNLINSQDYSKPNQQYQGLLTQQQQNIYSKQQHQQQQQQQQQQQHLYHQNNQQNFFAQNLPTPQQQRPASLPPPPPPPSGSYQQSIWNRPVYQNPGQKIYATPVSHTDDARHVPSTTVAPTTTTTPLPATSASTQAPTPTTSLSPLKEAKIKQNIANLPDEVPDDIRQQLLSSGILGNADIQILDYDKIGDIPIENLPPEALANFYGAGGASAVAASEPVPSIVKRPKSAELSAARKEIATLVERSGGVEMKLVRFDPNTEQGQAIADQHIREDATHLKPVTIGERDIEQYSRYLPLKVSGASFPIPNVPELEGRKISSVVVLAPIDYNFQDEEADRQGRKLNEPQTLKYLTRDTLKQLIKKPTGENYKKWLEQESQMEPLKQSIVLLVTTPKDDAQGDRQIFMYNVNSQAVSKLSDDLSSAFVDDETDGTTNLESVETTYSSSY